MAKSISGYKTPPLHSRWKKGQSGNPSGRVKGQRNLETDLLAELNEVMHITEDGIQRRITKQRALVKRLIASGIGGDARAIEQTLRLLLLLKGVGADPPNQAPLSSEDDALLDAYIQRKTLRKDTSHD